MRMLSCPRCFKFFYVVLFSSTLIESEAGSARTTMKSSGTVTERGASTVLRRRSSMSPRTSSVGQGKGAVAKVYLYKNCQQHIFDGFLIPIFCLGRIRETCIRRPTQHDIEARWQRLEHW